MADTLTLSIEGMTCASFVAPVEKVLKAVPGAAVPRSTSQTKPRASAKAIPPRCRRF